MGLVLFWAGSSPPGSQQTRWSARCSGRSAVGMGKTILLRESVLSVAVAVAGTFKSDILWARKKDTDSYPSSSSQLLAKMNGRHFLMMEKQKAVLEAGTDLPHQAPASPAGPG